MSTMLKVNVGDRIVSAETGKMYVVEGIEGVEYKCKDTDGGGYAWLLKTMVNERRFWKEEQA